MYILYDYLYCSLESLRVCNNENLENMKERCMEGVNCECFLLLPSHCCGVAQTHDVLHELEQAYGVDRCLGPDFMDGNEL